MNMRRIPKGDLVYGRRVWWADPDKSELIEVKVSSDNTRFYFVRQDATYELALPDLIKEVEKQVKVKIKVDKKRKK
jgi:hypothetical protein